MGRRGKAKGSQFERDLCTMLGRWWTDGQRDDVFWRSTISGGRATIRADKGKQTYGQAGDVQAVDPVGEPLLKVVTIEAKRGYSGVSLGDLLDLPDGSKSIWFDWFAQAERSWEQARSCSWLLIVKKDRRCILAVIPSALYVLLVGVNSDLARAFPRMKIRVNNRSLVALRLPDFLKRVRPIDIRKIANDWHMSKRRERRER